ncbi:hypothetical protein ACM55I_14435 [Flavobacterium sp. GB2R13]
MKIFSSIGKPGGGGGFFLPNGDGAGGSPAKAFIIPKRKIIKK